MKSYQLTAQVQQDLQQIRRFTITNWGEKQSTRYFNELKKTLQLLTEMPLMGNNCFSDLGENVYRFPFESHIIYYLTAQETTIVVIAILHQSMVPNKHLGSRL